LNISVPPDLPPGRSDEQRLCQVCSTSLATPSSSPMSVVSVQVTVADNMFTCLFLTRVWASRSRSAEGLRRPAGRRSSTRKQRAPVSLAIAKKIVGCAGASGWNRAWARLDLLVHATGAGQAAKEVV
jgi:hypothetical protein